jgi:hypothetical protein
VNNPRLVKGGLLGLAWMMDAPALVAASVADYWTIKSRFDPKLQTNFLARVQLQPLIVGLNEWRNHGIGAATRRRGASSQDAGEADPREPPPQDFVHGQRNLPQPFRGHECRASSATSRIGRCGRCSRRT